MATLLEMRNISKVFPGVRALDHVNLTVEQGEIHAICGENGAGKSTLMKVLSGVYPHGTYEGDVLGELEAAESLFARVHRQAVAEHVDVHHVRADVDEGDDPIQIGRASCRERV